jgi:hypothetical protein
MDKERFLFGSLHIMADPLIYPLWIIAEVIWKYFTFPENPTQLDVQLLNEGVMAIGYLSLFSSLLWVPHLYLYSVYRNKYPASKKAVYLVLPGVMLFIGIVGVLGA